MQGRISQDEKKRLIVGAQTLKDAPLYILDGFTSQETAQTLCTKTYDIARQYDLLGLIVIDGLEQLISGRTQGAIVDYVQTLHSLKQLAFALNVPILLLSSLSRGVEYRANKRPVLADLRGYGSVEEAASMVLFLYRDEVYYCDSEFEGRAELSVHGIPYTSGATICFNFNGEYLRFE